MVELIDDEYANVRLAGLIFCSPTCMVFLVGDHRRQSHARLPDRPAGQNIALAYSAPHDAKGRRVRSSSISCRSLLPYRAGPIYQISVANLQKRSGLGPAINYRATSISRSHTAPVLPAWRRRALPGQTKWRDRRPHHGERRSKLQRAPSIERRLLWFV